MGFVSSLDMLPQVPYIKSTNNIKLSVELAHPVNADVLGDKLPETKFPLRILLVKKQQIILKKNVSKKKIKLDNLTLLRKQLLQ